MVAQRNDWISPEEYLRIDREAVDIKYEYVDGRIYGMSGGSTSHSLLSINMLAMLKSYLRGKPCKAYNSDMRVHPSRLQYFYPDVTVSCDQKEIQEVTNDLYFPRLIIEVLSPSTEMRDRTEKFAQFQQCPTVEEYVLISQKRQTVEVYTRNGKKWIYELFGPGEEVEFASIDFRFPIEALYEDVPLSTGGQEPQSES